jgi:hypothetical protein
VGEGLDVVEVVVVLDEVDPVPVLRDLDLRSFPIFLVNPKTAQLLPPREENPRVFSRH